MLHLAYARVPFGRRRARLGSPAGRAGRRPLAVGAPCGRPLALRQPVDDKVGDLPAGQPVVDPVGELPAEEPVEETVDELPAEVPVEDPAKAHHDPEEQLLEQAVVHRSWLPSPTDRGKKRGGGETKRPEQHACVACMSVGSPVTPNPDPTSGPRR